MTSGSGAGGEPTAIQPPQHRHVPNLVQGRVAGARHLREGKPCQDAIRGIREGEIVVLAVADGHGTSTHGDIGATLAVDVAVKQLLRFAAEVGIAKASDPQVVQAFAEHPLRIQLAREWANRVREHAGDEDAELQPYGSTLLFALATPEYLLVGQLGDGDILVVDGARQVVRPIAPDPNNFADETMSLCQKEAWTAIRVRATPAPNTEELLLLSTDGYSKSYETDDIFELIGPGYLDMFRAQGAGAVEQQLQEILELVTSGGSGDDIALGILYWTTIAGTVQDGSNSHVAATMLSPTPIGLVGTKGEESE